MLIINADDFGISKGVNLAIIKMATENRLNSVSVFAKAKYTQEAINFCEQNKQILAGLHFNLTTGKSILGNNNLPLLTDKNGDFKMGFIALLVSVLFKPKILNEIEKELVAQLETLKNIEISHIDGHRHVHFIPKIFNIVYKISKQRNIKRIRIINEGLFSFINCKKLSFLFDGGLIKLIILRLCGLFNGSYKIKAPYMFSILYTGKITNDLIKNINSLPKNFDSIEIMIHPGTPEIDKNEHLEYEKEALLCKYRDKEAELKFKM